MLWRVEGYVGGKGDLQRGEGQLDITSIELLFVANVCVLGTCYHSYKGLIFVWSLRHGPVLWGGWTRTAGWPAALVQLEIHLGVRVGVVHLRVSLPPGRLCVICC